jgi:hypothetical protein
MTKKPRKSARRHAKIENLSIAGASGRFGPVGLILYADHFLSAAKTADNAPPPQLGGLFVPARLFLACRTLELALKAFLSLKKCSLEELAGGVYGHDLESLMVEAEKRGLQALFKFEDRQQAEIVRASTYYFEKVFEYPALMEAVHGYPKLPDASLLIDAAEALVSALREPCRYCD